MAWDEKRISREEAKTAKKGRKAPALITLPVGVFV